MKKELREVRTNRIAGSVAPKNCNGRDQSRLFRPVKIGKCREIGAGVTGK